MPTFEPPDQGDCLILIAPCEASWLDLLRQASLRAGQICSRVFIGTRFDYSATLSFEAGNVHSDASI